MTEARHLLAEALNCRVEDLPEDAAIGNTPGWDSLAHARVMLALEERLDRQLSTDEIAAIGGLADIVAILAAAR
ncbi:MAG: acyl carrier protein [Azospirillaceae bacterium]